MNFEPDTVNVEGLNSLLKALKGPPPQARVGILGGKDARKAAQGEKAVPGNAEIGAAHEYGSPSKGIPQRSFLRVPISDHLQKKMDGSGLFTEDTTKQVINSKSVVPWLKTVAILAEDIVKEAFQTKGFGKWAPWKIPGYTSKTGDILVDTTQLRDSIVSEVKEG